MSDLTYSVLIDVSMRESGAGISQLNSKLESAGSHSNRLAVSIGRLGLEMNSVFQRAVEHAASFAEHIAMIGVGGGIAAITWAITKLDTQLETMQIGFAGAFMSEGVVNSMPKALAVSSNLIEKMRADSAKLPVEFKDLATVFQSALIPGLSTGASLDKIERISQLATVVGASTRIGAPQVATELSMLLSGVVRSTSPLARMLGITGEQARKEFKSLAPEERFEYISKKLEAWSPAINEFSRSFIGLWTTVKTNVFSFLQMATGPLFERIKGALSGVNSWFQSHQGVVQNWADYIGVRLGMAFDWVKDKVVEWGPILLHFVQEATRRIMSFAARLGDMFGGLKTMLTNDDIFNKIRLIAGLYAASKVGGGILSAAMPMMYARGGIGGALGLGEGAAAGLGGFAAAGLGIFAAAAVGAAGVLTAAADKESAAHESAIKEMGEFSIGLTQLSHTVTDTHGVFGAIQIAGVGLLSVLNQLIGEWVDFFTKINYGWRKLMGETDEQIHPITKWGPHLAETFRKEKSAVGGETELDKIKKAIAGSGNTHIGNVNFYISGSQEPSRIARVAVSHLVELAKHRTSSSDAPNWSAKRR